MANFIDFIADAANDFELAREFIEFLDKASAEELQNWLNEKDYDLSIDDCKKLVDNKENIVNIKEVSTREGY